MSTKRFCANDEQFRRLSAVARNMLTKRSILFVALLGFVAYPTGASFIAMAILLANEIADVFCKRLQLIDNVESAIFYFSPVTEKQSKNSLTQRVPKP